MLDTQQTIFSLILWPRFCPHHHHQWSERPGPGPQPGHKRSVQWYVPILLKRAASIRLFRCSVESSWSLPESWAASNRNPATANDTEQTEQTDVAYFHSTHSTYTVLLFLILVFLAQYIAQRKLGQPAKDTDSLPSLYFWSLITWLSMKSLLWNHRYKVKVCAVSCSGWLIQSVPYYNVIIMFKKKKKYCPYGYDLSLSELWLSFVTLLPYVFHMPHHFFFRILRSTWKGKKKKITLYFANFPLFPINKLCSALWDYWPQITATFFF